MHTFKNSYLQIWTRIKKRKDRKHEKPECISYGVSVVSFFFPSPVTIHKSFLISYSFTVHTFNEMHLHFNIVLTCSLNKWLFFSHFITATGKNEHLSPPVRTSSCELKKFPARGTVECVLRWRKRSWTPLENLLTLLLLITIWILQVSGNDLKRWNTDRNEGGMTTGNKDLISLKNKNKKGYSLIYLDGTEPKSIINYSDLGKIYETILYFKQIST